MLCNLIEKYGVVPKTAYPESKASSGSREPNDPTITSAKLAAKIPVSYTHLDVYKRQTLE